MKRYHALGIIIAATVIFVSACSMAIASEQERNCPTPNPYNTGFVLTDEDNDGKSDHIYRVYNTGICIGQLVDPDDTGIHPELDYFDQ